MNFSRDEFTSLQDQASMYDLQLTQRSARDGTIYKLTDVGAGSSTLIAVFDLDPIRVYLCGIACGIRKTQELAKKGGAK